MRKYKYKLSILMLVYNHERYIIEALDSIKGQIKNFTYEILVGEDCSTDNTRAILQNYNTDGLENFRLVLREKNIGGLNNLLDLCERAEGEYIILLEGDDFWIDPHKLSRQIEFLDGNKEYIAVSHKSVVIDEFSNVLPYAYSAECYKEEYTLKEFRKGILPGQSTSIMYRNHYREAGIFRDMQRTVDFPGDRRIAFSLAATGKVRCWKERMSAYRHILLDGSSYSAANRGEEKYQLAELEFYHTLYRYSLNSNMGKEISRISAQCYYKSLFGDMIRKNPVWERGKFWKELWREKYKISVLYWIVYNIFTVPIKKYISKKQLLRAREMQLQNRKKYEIATEEKDIHNK